MFVVITGKPCVGKSSIINHLNEKGLETYKIDDYVNEIYQRGRIGYDLIKQEFGREYVNEREVNKKLLGELIIDDHESYIKLRRLIWPLIRSHLKDLKKKKNNLIVEMAIYMIDPEFFNNIFDFVIEIKRKQKDIQDNEKNKYDKFFTTNNKLNVNFVISNYWTWEYTTFVTDQLFDIIK